MKKCVIMFTFLVLALLLAILTDNGKKEVIPSDNYTVGKTNQKMLLATVRAED